jgi:ferredoxin
MPDSTPTPGRGPVPAGWLLGVDWSACDGRGWCVELLPELLTRDRWGYPLAREHGAAPGRASREITVPGALVAHAQRAVGACPRLALRLRPAHQA